ncbi:Uncharacterised protein [Mycobacteroides abscessus subsp. abscessus]|nr:Uncharacterised protein [Mycobacteroides abscessus subsp. abscessus]
MRSPSAGWFWFWLRRRSPRPSRGAAPFSAFFPSESCVDSVTGFGASAGRSSAVWVGSADSFWLDSFCGASAGADEACGCWLCAA